ncbi:hypothetical protein ANCCEY_03667 [Ancylostoma ceylanicum]|uniref:Integrase zinc-binding domain-containing protein n=1 Tax=Ancylostoma ceylanicum TaxID=53326 RepID=A0A0D6MAV3_9BILA|nr:hypothetical protein ANCCEY_03667 [Ancylostoma ceylanicum]
MELDAITLALRLTNAVLSQLSTVLKIQAVYIFSDSEIVFNWIKHRPLTSVGVRILNRLIEIGKITQHLQSMGLQVYFAYIATKYNMADCATRGLTQKELDSHFWWTGPDILKDPPESWPSTFNAFNCDAGFENEHQGASTIEKEAEIVETLKEPKEVLVTKKDLNKIQTIDLFVSLRKYSLQNAKRVVALVLSYIRVLAARANARRKFPIKLSALLEEVPTQNTPQLSGKEIATAGKMLVKQHQLATITPAILKSLKHLNIKFDPNDLLRCFGRLGKSDLDGESKIPLIVLQNSWLAEAIIRDCHNNGHPGISHTMSLVRQSFWIPKLRAQVTRVIRRCIPCQKFNNLPYKYPEQGDLPAHRCDGTEGKSYGCIITCMATRLIHLDVVSDLSTTAFLMMLHRFFARCGLPEAITSDNAPTFTLGETILGECLCAIKNDPAVERTITNREIQWKHITGHGKEASMRD